MPIIKSAKKRVKTAHKAAVRNSKTKRTLKGALKDFHKSVTGANHSKAQSAIDKAAKKGLVHKNKAARLKKQAAAKAKAAGAKTTAKPAAKKAPAKKTTTKTTTARKPAAKKTTKK